MLIQEADQSASAEGWHSPGYQIVHLQPEDLLQHGGVSNQVAQRPQACSSNFLSLV